MKYKIEDINFSKITPKAFENLCYDLLVNYNFQNIIWRDGGGDNGRDIEAVSDYSNPFSTVQQKWFFECKHYSNGVPPTDLHSKIAWADAEQPDFLVFFISSYITVAARTWLEKIASQKKYRIILVEGEELKQRIIKYSDLVERYFASDAYEKLFRDIKDYKIKFNLKPSYEVLKELIENLDLAKLDIDDLGFIIINFYDQYKGFESREGYHEDFIPEIINKILQHLKNTVTNEDLHSFEQYKENYDELDGVGFFDEMHWLKDVDQRDIEIKNYNFQYYVLHLNNKKDQKYWNVGFYLLALFEDVAIEIFQESQTEIRIIKNFTPEKFEQISLNLPIDIIGEYKNYKQSF